MPAIEAKLSVDGEAIGTATAQFYYVYLNLESNVQSLVLPQLDDPSDYRTILASLARIYQNPHKMQEAQDHLHSLVQGSDPLHTYIGKFERALYAASAITWPESAKISAFRKGLSSTLRNRLKQYTDLPNTYEAYVSRI